MSTILVTGGTGGLGRPTVDLLRATGRDVRVLSRKPGDGRVVGDLKTGEGLATALAGIDTVLHLATSRWRDAGQTRALLTAANAAAVEHLAYISIVGIEGNPYGYYRDKLECERLVEQSGIPFTILRATQFHDFVGMFLRAQRRLPALLVLDVPVQPIGTTRRARCGCPGGTRRRHRRTRGAHVSRVRRNVAARPRHRQADRDDANPGQGHGCVQNRPAHDRAARLRPRDLCGVRRAGGCQVSRRGTNET